MDPSQFQIIISALGVIQGEGYSKGIVVYNYCVLDHFSYTVVPSCCYYFSSMRHLFQFLRRGELRFELMQMNLSLTKLRPGQMYLEVRNTLGLCPFALVNLDPVG
jgi:hypothetical protein